MAVAATTNGSIADKTCDESLPFSELPDAGVLGALIPKESNDTFPSLLCDPTLPINDDVMEQARIETNPLRELFLQVEKQGNEAERAGFVFRARV